MNGSVASRSIDAQIGSDLSAKYQPMPAAGPSPFSSYSLAMCGSVPYDMPDVCVSRSRIWICRRAGTISTPPSARRSATVVFAKAGMKRLTGSARRTWPSSTSIMTAALVMAFDCEAIRKIESTRIGSFASRSRQPSAFSYTVCPSWSTTATRPATRFSST